MLHVLQTLLAPHSTLWTIGHTVVHLDIFRSSDLFGLRFKDGNVSLNVALHSAFSLGLGFLDR